MTDTQEAQQGKVLVNYDQLCGFADHARRVGTLDAFADVALQWAGQADKEIERLLAENAALSGEVQRRRQYVEGYDERYTKLEAAIERLRGLLCKCDMRTRLVGDGCEFCNPQLAEELAKEQR